MRGVYYNLPRPLVMCIESDMSNSYVYCNLTCPIVMIVAIIMSIGDVTLCIAICHVHWSCILQSAISIGHLYCNL